ncbi:MAG TPA: Hint domain-containing protein [Stellaceae bacterium]|nr:Hint domain-containing protein [Stellaceae bacterium]
MSIISTTITSGITLGASGYYASPLTITSTGAIEPADGIAIYGDNSEIWTVVNYGTVKPTGAGGIGIAFAGGGTIANGSGGATTALIAGGVGNTGGTGGGAIGLLAAGSIANAGTVAGGAGGAGAGSSSGSGQNGGFGGIGINLLGGAEISNSGEITGGYGGGGGAAAQGYIGGRGGSGGTGIHVSGGVEISNSGEITGGRGGGGGYKYGDGGSGGAGINLSSGNISNAGTIIGGAGGNGFGWVPGTYFYVGLGGSGGAGIDLSGNGTITNTGTIAGGWAGGGAQIRHGYPLVGDGIDLYGGGTVINGGPSATSALIYGNTGVAAWAATVINYGTIRGIRSAIGLGPGTLTNLGIVESGQFPSGVSANVVNNSGTIDSLIRAGSVNNSGVVIGAIYTDYFLINYGTIVSPFVPGSYNAGALTGSGTFINHGVVLGSVYGILVSLGTSAASGGSVTVAGTVSGATGIKVVPNATIGQTITVYGSVTGTAGTATALAGGSDRLIVAPGAAFTGYVDGGGGTSVLEIAPAGAAGIAGVAGGVYSTAYVSLGSVVNFSALEIDPSATFSGLGALRFDTLVNEGQINIGSGNALTLGVVPSVASAGLIDLQQGGTIDFDGAVGNQTLIFQPPGGTAVIDHPELFSATISGFTATNDILDLTSIDPTTATVSLDPVSERLIVSDASQTVSLQLDTAGEYSGIAWQITADGSGGTEVTPCFCRGTQILTEAGEVPVEALAVGDRVKTFSGAMKPICWIGFGRDLVTAKNPLARPIIVRRGALADEVPRRDLYLTHGHALHFDGVLIPVEHLVNHRSILRDDEARVVEYYHIELADHDVVWADGAPAESYYDAGNRALFHNTRPGSQPGAARPTFAPVLHKGEIVGRVWAALNARAGARGPAGTTDDPDLHLVVAGLRLDPASVADGLYTFAFAAPPSGPLLLASRSAVPSLLGVSRHEHRRLGVAIRQIVLSAPGLMTAFTHDAPLFADGGCHPAEAGFCWTDGRLALAAPLFTHLAGPFRLLVHTAALGMCYPLGASAALAA